MVVGLISPRRYVTQELEGALVPVTHQRNLHWLHHRLFPARRGKARCGGGRWMASCVVRATRGAGQPTSGYSLLQSSRRRPRNEGRKLRLPPNSDSPRLYMLFLTTTATCCNLLAGTSPTVLRHFSIYLRTVRRAQHNCSPTKRHPSVSIEILSQLGSLEAETLFRPCDTLLPPSPSPR